MRDTSERADAGPQRGRQAQDLQLTTAVGAAFRRLVAVSVVVATSLVVCRSASGYSVLAHQAMVDALWVSTVAPLLRQRFPGITREQITAARAYAYGGSVIQDLGYYPFGSKLFTNLVHYVRSGDFVEALIHHAQDPNEYAFALGALAHYASDNAGHPLGVNRAVPIVYPKVRAKFGDEVLFADSPARHIMVEFAFDVLQVGSGSYTPQGYRDFIGFEVAKPLLAKAFRETYALDLDDLFVSEDLAVGTYRRAVSTTIPELTRLAWEDKQDEIRNRTPGIDRDRFVFVFTRQDYEKAYGATYERPGILSRFVFALMKILPKIGPLRPLAFEPLTDQALELMEASFAAARERYRTLLKTVGRQPATSARAMRLAVVNTDLDTGKPATRTYNPLVEQTYAELVDKLSKQRFARVSEPLRADLTRHYSSPVIGRALTGKELKRDHRARRQLESMSRS